MDNRHQPSGNRVLNRAFAASAALVLGIAVATGAFVVKIADSFASATHPAGTTNTNQGGLTGNGSNDGSPSQIQAPDNGGAQLTQPPQNQAPVGRSNGS